MSRLLSRSLRRWRRWAETPVDGAGLALFRVVFGSAMLFESYRYASKGWFRSAYIGPGFHFSFPGFGWLHDLPLPSANILEAVLMLSAVLIACGALYRLAAATFFLVFSFIFLYEQTQYLNHFYLISLLSFIAIIVPMHRTFSIDSIIVESLHKRKKLNTNFIQFFFPGASEPLPAPFVFAWEHWLVVFQISIAYLYGGIAKLLTPDWLAGYPMRFWIQGRTDVPLFGPFVNERWMAVFMSDAGMVFDLCIVPLILWRKTRYLGILLMLVFNLTNAKLFHIGIFPWLMIGSIPLFLGPDWPRRAWDLLTLDRMSREEEERTRESARERVISPDMTRRTARLLCAFVVFQLLFPLRHLLYPGNVQWTEEGGLFAWQMKLRDKRGYLSYRVQNAKTGEMKTVDPRPLLAPSQRPELATHPDLIWQFAQRLADDATADKADIRVFADSFVSLNGRPMERLVDPSVDLAHAAYPLLGTASWILPLTSPLPADPQPLSNEGADADI